MTKTDHEGTHYGQVIENFHRWLEPATYLEIGTLEGYTLGLARCASIAVDPEFKISHPACVRNKPECHLFQTTSDDFFARHDPTMVLGRPVSLAFLDGMHLCEFLLRDFINTEKHCRRDSVVILHDCLPLEAGMTTRDRMDSSNEHPDHAGWWTGDVWRTALALKRFRPDLRVSAFDAPPTGLVVVTNLHQWSTVLAAELQTIVHTMMSWDYDREALSREFGVESTEAIDTAEKLLRRFPRDTPIR